MSKQNCKAIIPWIGHSRHYETNIELLGSKGFRVLGYHHAYDGLEELKRNQYPIVLVQHVPSNVEKINLEGVDLNDITEVTCGIVRIIKEMPNYSQSTIIVPHLGIDKIQQRKLQEAGASRFVDLRSDTSLDDLVKAVKESLIIERRS